MQRWQERLVAKMKPKTLRFVDAGTTKEARRVNWRPAEMPSATIETSQMVDEFLARKKINRGACKGIMPQGSYGHKLRKARGEIVRPESGRNCNAGKIAAPPQGSLMARCWSTDTEWKIVRKPGA